MYQQILGLRLGLVAISSAATSGTLSWNMAD